MRTIKHEKITRSRKGLRVIIRSKEKRDRKKGRERK